MSTTETLSPVDRYRQLFASTEVERADEPAALARQRRASLDAFAEQGFPTIKEEAWRFTNLAPLARLELVGAPVTELRREQIEPFVYPGAALAVLIDGRFTPALSDLEGLPPSVRLESLSSAIERDPSLIDELGRNVPAELALAQLTSALWPSGLYLHVPRGQRVERPLEILSISTAAATARASFPRLLMVFEETSEARVIERYVGLGEGAYFTAPLTEIRAGRAANVDHYRLQEEAGEAFHVATQIVYTERDANVSSHTLSVAGRLIRNDIRAFLDGEGVQCRLDGLYLPRDGQHVDTQMKVDHLKPHGYSHELYKGVLTGKSRAVFNGLIHVHQDAQKTDAVQTNRNLLLSPEALVNTNPQLEIFADDVKCTHGSTVGQLDEDAVFYLRSRGIDASAARSLLTWAFASEVVGALAYAPLREQMEELLIHRLPQGEVVRQAL